MTGVQTCALPISDISGTRTVYAGGGGGYGSTTQGTGGVGGGGTAANGTANTGGGAGANDGTSKSGGSGIVIVRYPDIYRDAVSVTNGSKTTYTGYKVYTFTQSGAITF